MSDEPLKTEAIRGLLAHLLAGAAGGSEAKWRKLIEIEVLPIATNVHCNWRVTPAGSAAELEAIRQAVAIVAAEHPYASDRRL